MENAIDKYGRSFGDINNRDVGFNEGSEGWLKVQKWVAKKHL